MIHTNVVITEYKNRICAMIFCDNQLEDLHVEAKESLLGNIYIAKVKNINKNINAAFLELFDGQMAFLPLEDVQESAFLQNGFSSQKNDSSKVTKLREGDELPVQIIKEGVKTKDPVVTSKLSVNGAYAVVTLDKRKGGLQYSKKLSKAKKQELQVLIQQTDVEKQLKDAGYAAVIRTGVGDLEDKVGNRYEIALVIFS